MSMTPLSVDGINSAIISQVETEIGSTIPILPIAFVRVIAKAFAGVVVLLYKYTGFIFFQMFVATASDEPTTISGTTITPLTEWGRLVGAGDPVPAVAAEMTATVTVINQTGDPIPAGTSLVYDPTGVIYVTTATVLKDAATKVITIEAASDQTGGDGLGSIGNLQIGDLVSFTGPVADVVRDASIASIVTSGEDAEPSVQYRQRIIDRFQKPPQGGALADYEIWGEEAAGIINVYPYTGALPGTVENYCEADPVSSGSPDGIPTQPQLDAALALINLDVSGRATRRPANALASTLPITRKAFEVDIVSLAAPDPAATQTAITDGLNTLFATFEPFIGGLTVTPRDRVTQAEVSGVVFDIAQANNATFSSVLLKSQGPQQSTFGAFVSASSDDASETGGSVALAGTVLLFDVSNTIGVRFTNVNIPAGATIISATLSFTSPSVKNPYSVLTVRGEADANASTFTTTASDISSRVNTINLSTWIPDAWAVDVEKSVDVKSIVEDIIAIPGWAALNAMVFKVTAAAGSDREARSYDDDPSKAPRLSITFTAPGASFAAIEVVTLGKGEKAKVTTVSFT
jgi:uncharacterized phage protein gp47/JayE